jgi:hypothetical protein
VLVHEVYRPQSPRTVKIVPKFVFVVSRLMPLEVGCSQEQIIAKYSCWLPSVSLRQALQKMRSPSSQST